jgi:hypothetical protein
MRRASAAVVVGALFLLLASPAVAETPQRTVDRGGDRLSYVAGEWCSFPLTYRYRFTLLETVFASSGVATRVESHVRSSGWFRNDVTGAIVTFRSSSALTIDLTVADFTSDAFIYRGLLERFSTADGRTVAVRTGQLRIDRSGDVTFEAGPAASVDVCPYLG